MIPADPCGFYDAFSPQNLGHLAYSISDGAPPFPVQFLNAAGEVVVEITDGRVIGEVDGACPNEPCSGVIELDFNFLVDLKFVPYEYKQMLNGQVTFDDPTATPAIESPNGDPITVQFAMLNSACGANTIKKYELFDQNNVLVMPPGGPAVKNRFYLRLGCGGC